ncbi:hypothetical protein BC833DRAFT_612690 [Globomyces pollinis-pini]|nr:hypothetical protein BC833DRAFT_612690 [Globomyces pollinis-pini]
MGSMDVKTLTICTTILLFKFIITLSMQGNSRFNAGSRPPEDSNLRPGASEQSFGLQTNAEKHLIEKEMRWNRIVANDLENIPIGLIIFLVSILARSNEIVTTICLILFTVGRLGHTIAYAYSLQPYRTVFWVIALLSVLVSSINSIVGSFAN